MKKLLLSFFALTALLFCAHAQPAGILNYISSTKGGGCYTVEYYNNHLFAGAGNTVMAYSTDPVSGSITGLLSDKRLGSNITDMRMYGTHLLVAANHDGIYMFSTASLPAALTTEAHYIPDSTSEAAYNLATKGDTVFVAYKRKMAAFRIDTISPSFSLISRFGQLPASLPNARVRGCDAKGNLVAYTVSTYSTAAASDAVTGIYIVDAAQANYPQLSYHQQTLADPEDVIFGKNTNLLHVMGGTESYAQPNHPEGLFYSLDVSNPSSPLLVYSDTIGKFGVTLAYIQTCQPMKAVNINDTIYVAALGAPDTSNTVIPSYGHTYVYKATSNSQVSCINSVYAGLWHFDVAVNKKKMYVASEWYGIKTIDLTTLASGGTDLGNHLTGGWNKGGDRKGNRLLLANEGYGFRTFDITNPSTPVFQGADSVNQFCWGANFSGDGNYIYGHYYSSNDFRVFDANTYQLVGSADNYAAFVDPRRSRSWHSKAVSIYHVGLADNIVVINAATPSAPVFEYTRLYGIGENIDLALDTAGNMYIMREDSLTVYDINTHARKAALLVPGGTLSNFKTIAVWKDTIFAVVDHWMNAQDGIYKFYFNGTNTLTQVGGPYALPVAATTEFPKYAAADSFGVYLAYQEHDLRALSHNNLSQTGYYRHGEEFFRVNDYGPQDIYSKEGILFLVEYFGQTSMFYTDSSQVVTGLSSMHPGTGQLLLYPNPVNDICTIALPDAGGRMEIEVVDAMGRIIKTAVTEPENSGNYYGLDLSGLPGGIYLVRVTGNNLVCSGRIIKK